MRVSIVAGALLFPLALPILAQVRDSRTASSGDIKRKVLIDQRSTQVMRTTYLPGAVEPPGPHKYDVVLVPLSEGAVRLVIAGTPADWQVGSAIFIPRNTEHEFANIGKTPLEFVSIRIP